MIIDWSANNSVFRTQYIGRSHCKTIGNQSNFIERTLFYAILCCFSLKPLTQVHRLYVVDGEENLKPIRVVSVSDVVSEVRLQQHGRASLYSLPLFIDCQTLQSVNALVAITHTHTHNTYNKLSCNTLYIYCLAAVPVEPKPPAPRSVSSSSFTSSTSGVTIRSNTSCAIRSPLATAPLTK